MCNAPEASLDGADAVHLFTSLSSQKLDEAYGEEGALYPTTQWEKSHYI